MCVCVSRIQCDLSIHSKDFLCDGGNGEVGSDPGCRLAGGKAKIKHRSNLNALAWLFSGPCTVTQRSRTEPRACKGLFQVFLCLRGWWHLCLFGHFQVTLSKDQVEKLML